MPTRMRKVSVRHQPGVRVVDLYREINAFAENVLNDAYAGAEMRELDVILSNFNETQGTDEEIYEADDLTHNTH